MAIYHEANEKYRQSQQKSHDLNRGFFQGSCVAVLRIRRWRHIACHLVGPLAEEMVFHLPQQVLAGAGIGQVEAVFVDQHGLVAQPVAPCLFAHVFENALTDGAGVGRAL